MHRLILAVLLLCTGMAEAAPRRIVSMNLCADELVLRLADLDQVVSVTWLARDPKGSNVATLAMQVERNRGLAEEVMAARADLVIAGRYTTRTTVFLLQQMGQPVLELDVPETFDAVRDQIRLVAAAVGHPERGEAMIAEMEARLAAIGEGAGAPPRAVVLRPNGYTVGAGSLVDTLITRAGFANLAADPGLAAYRQMPLEVLVQARPDFVILDSEPYPEPALAYEVLQHPVLARLPNRPRVIGLPSRLWTCAGPAIVEAVEIMAQARLQP